MAKFYALAIVAFVFAIGSVALASPVKSTAVFKPKRADPYEGLRFVIMADDNGKLHLVDLQQEGKATATMEDVTFYLYTRKSSSPEVIPAVNFKSQLLISNFDKNLKSLFIIHGWNNEASSAVNEVIRAAALAKYDINVFVVDWSGPANTLNYVSAKNNAPIVGSFVGDCLNYMINTVGYSASNIYMSGHSLGAHACGAAGARTGGKITSIVGMDAAKPLFSMEETADRLDTTDAQYVHVIHTNAGLLGFSEAIGHSDYYPNGGESQPGCGLDLAGKCSHGRSYYYFAESIRSGGFSAYECDSYDSFEDGLCSGNHRSQMGLFDVDKTASGMYFLDTHSEEPFALG